MLNARALVPEVRRPVPSPVPRSKTAQALFLTFFETMAIFPLTVHPALLNRVCTTYRLFWTCTIRSVAQACARVLCDQIAGNIARVVQKLASSTRTQQTVVNYHAHPCIIPDACASRLNHALTRVPSNVGVGIFRSSRSLPPH